MSDHNFRILTKPLSLVNTFVYNNDTIDCQSDEWKFLNVKSFSEKDIYYFRTENDYYTSFLKIEFHNDSPNVDFNFDTEFKQSLNIIKSSLLMPFRDDDFKIYRRNPLIDTVDYQDVYYLDKEGFSLVYNDKQLVSTGTGFVYKKTNGKAYLMTNSTEDFKPQYVTDVYSGANSDGNNVELEREMMDLSKTGTKYLVLSNLARRQFSSLSSVIRGQ